MTHDYSTSELELTETVIKEVVTTRSHYFGELVVVTHKALAIGMAWYKCRMPHGEWVWFKSEELEGVE